MNKAFTEQVDEGMEEIDKAFENYRMCLEFGEDDTISSDYDFKSQVGIKKREDSVGSGLGSSGRQSVKVVDRSSRRTKRRGSLTSTVSILDEINEDVDEKKWKRTVSIDPSTSWPKVIAVISLSFLTGLVLTIAILLPSPGSLSKLGNNLSFGTDISSFAYKFSKIFADNNRPIDRRLHVPVFYELAGNDALIRNTFSNCFRFAESAQSFSDESISTATSLCDLVDQKLTTPNIKLFLILRNPIIRTVLSYLNQMDPNSKYYNDTMIGMKFEEFLNSDFIEWNQLTRSLVCKTAKEKLTQADLEYAKYFLTRKCNVKFYYNQGYEKALFDIKQILDGGYKSINRNRRSYTLLSADEKLMTCVSNEMPSNWIRYSPSIIEKFVFNYANDMLERNSYDMELYSLALDLYLGIK